MHCVFVKDKDDFLRLVQVDDDYQLENHAFKLPDHLLSAVITR